MGILGLWPVLSPAGRNISLEHLRGQTVAVDVALWAAQFSVFGDNDKDDELNGSSEVDGANILAFRRALVRRLARLVFWGIRPVFVLDGQPPALKHRTLARRRMQKDSISERQFRAAAVRLLQRRQQELVLATSTTTNEENGGEAQSQSATGAVIGTEEAVDTLERRPEDNVSATSSGVETGSTTALGGPLLTSPRSEMTLSPSSRLTDLPHSSFAPLSAATIADLDDATAGSVAPAAPTRHSSGSPLIVRTTIAERALVPDVRYLDPALDEQSASTYPRLDDDFENGTVPVAPSVLAADEAAAGATLDRWLLSTENDIDHFLQSMPEQVHQQQQQHQAQRQDLEQVHTTPRAMTNSSSYNLTDLEEEQWLDMIEGVVEDRCACGYDTNACACISIPNDRLHIAAGPATPPPLPVRSVDSDSPRALGSVAENQRESSAVDAEAVAAAGVDLSVFRDLPAELQKDILASVKRERSAAASRVSSDQRVGLWSDQRSGVAMINNFPSTTNSTVSAQSAVEFSSTQLKGLIATATLSQVIKETEKSRAQLRATLDGGYLPVAADRTRQFLLREREPQVRVTTDRRFSTELSSGHRKPSSKPQSLERGLEAVLLAGDAVVAAGTGERDQSHAANAAMRDFGLVRPAFLQAPQQYSLGSSGSCDMHNRFPPFIDSEPGLRLQQKTIADLPSPLRKLPHGRLAGASSQNAVHDLRDIFGRADAAAIRREGEAVASIGDVRQLRERTDTLRHECEQLFRLFGVPFLQAPGEAEAQCAQLADAGIVSGIITDDSDIFAFLQAKGDRNVFVYRNVFRRHRDVELYSTEDIRRLIGLAQQDVVSLALLLGCDYCDGVRGIGGVSALDVLATFGNDMNLFREWIATGTASEPGIEVPQSLRAWRGKLWREVRGLSPPGELSDVELLGTLPSDFPSDEVRRAFETARVENHIDTTQLQWSVPKLHDLRLYAQSKLEWDISQLDQLVLPAIYNWNPADSLPSVLNSAINLAAPASITDASKRSKAFTTSRRAQRAVSKLLTKRSAELSLNVDDETKSDQKKAKK